MFVSFEGIDGSGKSTQAALLARALRSRGQDVVAVREPGGTQLGEEVRRLLLDPQMEIDPRAELLLFSAARAQLVSEVLKPALQRGATVIADRFFDSSTAYQGGGRQIASREWLEGFHRFVTNGMVPDRTYLIDVDLSIAQERRGQRTDDRIEAGGAGFFSRVREAYLHLGQEDRVVVLDGSETEDQIHRRVLSDLDK